MSMYLSEKLEVKDNKLQTYFPFRTKDERKKVDWDLVLGKVVSNVYRKELLDDSFDNFTLLCQQKFEKKLDDNDFWSVIKIMYFDSQEALKIAPEFLLFSTTDINENQINKRIAEMFRNMLGETAILQLEGDKLNFIERSIFEILNNDGLKAEKEVTKQRKPIKEAPFLPYITTALQNDLRFLASKPSYLLANFKNFLKLYSFLYTSQLAHNLKTWREAKVAPKPNYFILDTEKACKERRYVRDFGCKELMNNIELIFPFLNMSQLLQNKETLQQPLWTLVEALDESSDTTNRLNVFAKEFAKDRNTKLVPEDKETTIEAIAQLLELSIVQFKTGNKNKDNINLDYVKAIKIHLCEDFIQNRGSAGSTLVLNQDYLILLTNIAIGSKENLRLHDLLKEFELRGVFFDNQSRQELVQFYERIGNVERMSDSGDAVYVSKTI